MMHDAVAAERDFRAGIAEMEKERSAIQEPDVRIAYFERAESLFDRLIELLLDQGRDKEALSIVERKRARTLLDQVAERGAAPDAPLDAPAIARAVRGPTALLEIALFDHGAELWLVRDGTVTHGRSAARREALAAAIARHAAALATGDSATLRQTGRWLYDQFVSPVESKLAPGGSLAIVADGDLQTFPFTTLITPAGAYLIDAYSVAVAPSASVLLRPSRAIGTGALVVAEPGPLGFASLPQAEAEAAQIAHLTGTRALVGSEITPAEFLKAVSNAGLVHFAGHAAADIDEPASSSLVFEGSDGRVVRLNAERIRRSSFRLSPLIVLAGCSTGKGKLRRTEGVGSLAVAFLEAGARGVVATLWDLDDEDSSRMFQVFHEQLRRGARPAEALRAAQRSFIHSNNVRDRSPAVWGGVVVIGTL
jgi:CHAT domain-containing protein